MCIGLLEIDGKSNILNGKWKIFNQSTLIKSIWTNNFKGKFENCAIETKEFDWFSRQIVVFEWHEGPHDTWCMQIECDIRIATNTAVAVKIWEKPRKLIICHCECMKYVDPPSVDTVKSYFTLIFKRLSAIFIILVVKLMWNVGSTAELKHSWVKISTLKCNESPWNQRITQRFSLLWVSSIHLTIYFINPVKASANQQIFSPQTPCNFSKMHSKISIFW